jgi:hypothetical protein
MDKVHAVWSYRPGRGGSVTWNVSPQYSQDWGLSSVNRWDPETLDRNCLNLVLPGVFLVSATP